MPPPFFHMFFNFFSSRAEEDSSSLELTIKTSVVYDLRSYLTCFKGTANTRSECMHMHVC